MPETEGDMENNVIKVAIIEDSKDVALLLQEQINDELDMTCKQVYFDAESAINFLCEFPADVVITDIGLPRLDGIAAIVAIRERKPETQFCMFTVFEDNDKIFNSLKAGAKGYILKNSAPEKIIQAIRELNAGGSSMNPEIARKVIDAFANGKSTAIKKVDLPLTARETELIELLSQGLLYKEIANSMGITTGTVKQHIHRIYHKLQVNNRTEAINLYLDR